MKQQDAQKKRQDEPESWWCDDRLSERAMSLARRQIRSDAANLRALSGHKARYESVIAFYRFENHQTGNGDPLAPRRLPCLLALEIEIARWSTEDTTGDSPARVHHGSNPDIPTE